MSLPKYREYKASGLSWADELPAFWSTASLKWLCKRYSGGTPDKGRMEFWENGTIPWLNSGAVNDGRIYEASAYITHAAFESSSAKWIPPGALLMALAGQGKTKGMVAQLMFESTCNQSMAAIVPTSRIDARFLYWWLTCNYQNIRNMAGGDLRDGLNLELLGAIPCPLPPAGEQVAIATFLDRETAKIDALIAEQEKLIGLLAEKRQAAISHAVTKGFNASAAMKNSGMSWLGEVPAHWEVKRFRDVCVSISTGPFGTALGSDDYVNCGVPVINPSHIVDNYIVPDDGVSVAKLTADKLSFWSLRVGDIVIARRGELGRAAIVQEESDGWICGTGSLRVTPNVTKATAGFLHAILQSTYAREWLKQASVGSTMPNINEVILGNLPIAFPRRVDEQMELTAALSERLSGISSIKVLTEESVALLRERRSALIAAAVTGQIQVRVAFPHSEAESREAIAA
jgi:type I restriction enzyme S subunit